MKKIRLDLSALAVSSFDTVRTGTGTGTVHGHDDSGYGTYADPSCAHSCYHPGCTDYCTMRTGCCRPTTTT